MQLGTRIEKLEEVLVHALLAGRVISLFLIVFFVEVLAVPAHVLLPDLKRVLMRRWVASLNELRVLRLLTTAGHQRLLLAENDRRSGLR